MEHSAGALWGLLAAVSLSEGQNRGCERAWMSLFSAWLQSAVPSLKAALRSLGTTPRFPQRLQEAEGEPARCCAGV